MKEYSYLLKSSSVVNNLGLPAPPPPPPPPPQKKKKMTEVSGMSKISQI